MTTSQTADDISSTKTTDGKTTEPSEIREQLRTLGDDVKELGKLSKAAIGDKVEAGKEAAQQAVEYGRERVVAYRDVLASKTRDEPIKSLLIAAGVGAFTCMLLRRR